MKKVLMRELLSFKLYSLKLYSFELYWLRNYNIVSVLQNSFVVILYRVQNVPRQS